MQRGVTRTRKGVGNHCRGGTLDLPAANVRFLVIFVIGKVIRYFPVYADTVLSMYRCSMECFAALGAEKGDASLSGGPLRASWGSYGAALATTSIEVSACRH